MKFIYVMFILVGLPLIGIIIGNLILEYWDSIIESLKGIGKCIGIILVSLLGLAITGIIGSWMFKAVGEGGTFLSFLVFIGFIALIFSGMKK